MGVTIHYSGRLDRVGDRPRLLDEVTDIAASMRWECRRIEIDAANSEFSGTVISPGNGCESLAFLFDHVGRLRTIADLVNNQVEPDPRYSFDVSVKTQFTALETHIWIVGLLRYLKNTYLADLKVTDDGEFWETGGAEALAGKRRFLQGKIDHLADGLNAMDNRLGSIDDVVARIKRILSDEGITGNL